MKTIEKKRITNIIKNIEENRKRKKKNITNITDNIEDREGKKRRRIFLIPKFFRIIKIPQKKNSKQKLIKNLLLYKKLKLCPNKTNFTPNNKVQQTEYLLILINYVFKLE